MEDHKKKKQTKQQMLDSIPNYVDKNLKDRYITNMIQGYEVAYAEILSRINDGYTSQEIKNFIEKNLSDEGKEVMRKVALKNN